MTIAKKTDRDSDPFDLNRFIEAQERDYDAALSEIKNGQKRTHWMWYIFPQIDGLAFSSTSRHYSIKSIEEAQAFLSHPVLGSRLLECAEAVNRVQGRTIGEIFGSPDDTKLRSCATLFASVSAPGSVFHQILEKYYQGRQDLKTIEVLASMKNNADG